MIRALIIVFLTFSLSYAGEFTVSPIKIELDRDSPSSAVTVTNDGNSPIDFVVREMEWFQDSEGVDQYRQSQDLIYFPKSFRLEPGMSRVIRVGVKKFQSLEKEKAYRLFIEEVPAQKVEGKAFVAIAIRFGVPIFIKPASEVKDIKLENVHFEKGQLIIAVKNHGNRHIRPDLLEITAYDEKGEEIYTKQVTGWYIFPNIKRKFSVELSQEECVKTKKLALTIKSDDKALREEIDVTKELCK